MRTGALVLAAGAGRRFGGPKQLARVDGRPLIEHALAAVDGVEPCVLVLGAHAGAIRAGADLGGVRTVVCADWEEGMAASLRCGLAALGGEADAVLVTLADQPFVTRAVVEAVLAATGEGVDAVRAAYDGVPGHPVLLGPALVARAAELRGDTGFRDLLAPARVKPVECGHLGHGADIDTREHLEALT